MKKFILLITVILTLVNKSFCQVDPSTNQNNKEYLGNQYSIKAKKQKTAAWVCLAGGFLLGTAGAVFAAPKVADQTISAVFLENTTQSYTGETILMMLGTAGVIASIPLFIASGRNKIKAKVAMSSQKTAFGLPGNVSRKISGITLSIPIGK